MGYSTDFEGAFNVTPALDAKQVAYINKFGETRRMKRNAELTAQRPDPIREAVGLPVGEDGGYFVGEDGFCGQDNGPDVVNHNFPPSSQPSLWCQWEASEDGGSIYWDGSEKFYCYVEWIEYIIEHFMKPWGRVLNGEVEWQGEDRNDTGKIVIKDNEVKTLKGKVTYEETN